MRHPNKSSRFPVLQYQQQNTRDLRKSFPAPINDIPNGIPGKIIAGQPLHNAKLDVKPMKYRAPILTTILLLTDVCLNALPNNSSTFFFAVAVDKREVVA